MGKFLFDWWLSVGDLELHTSRPILETRICAPAPPPAPSIFIKISNNYNLVYNIIYRVTEGGGHWGPKFVFPEFIHLTYPRIPPHYSAH